MTIAAALLATNRLGCFSHRKIAARVAFLSLLSFFLFTASPASAAIFNPESFTLKNGLRVVVIPNPRIPAITHMVWYKIGAMDEAPGKSGLAHFLEHLLFKGTKTMAPGEFSKIVARLGGTDNAFTSQDFTAYHQTIASDHLERVMKMEADRMQNLVLTDPIVLPERDVVLEERRSRFENNPAAKLSLKVAEALYGKHPYGKPVIGWADELASLTTADALAFYQRYYAPNNAILVVAGDVTAAKLRPLAEKIYGPIPRREIGPRGTGPETGTKEARRVVMHSTEVRQPSFLRRYLAPNQSSAAAGEAQALEVLAEILGGGGTSRLYRQLVVEQKLAAAAGAYYDPVTRGPASFSIYSSPVPGVTIETIETAVNTEIESLLRHGVEEKEVARAIRRLRASATYARDSLDTGARMLGATLSVGLQIADVERWPERIEKVTAAQVLKAAKNVLRIQRSATGLLLPVEAPAMESGKRP